MQTLDWASILTDAGTIAAIASALVIAIQFLKTIYYKLPWGWVQKTPGELWFALSIAAGLGVAIALNYQVLFDNSAPLIDRMGTVVYGLTIGAGSKVIHAVSSSAGAKLKVSKVENNQKLNGGAKESTCIVPPPTIETPIVTSEEATPLIVETPEPKKEELELTPILTQEDAKLFWEIPIDVDNYYVLVNDVLHHVSRKKVEE